MWKHLWKWACRRHPDKNKKWIKNRYFTQSRGKSWDFITERNQIQWYGQSKAPVGSYIKVKEGKSYYDGDTAYWAKRLSKGYGPISPSKAKMLSKQDGKCPVCDRRFKSEDLIEAHHIKAKMDGGSNTTQNLSLLHRYCHDQLHAINVGSVNKQKKRKGC
ncbi:MAG: hypothetical protein DRQ49_03685 [Gammaproteobacteria bacterium]|nr:MAG: hypothetical protein DRQ49_03685 [Gammaproteobacteria bacterium]RKZ74780.1 MAG: hypothetical protein DRQ57_09865 [Gammaproteobacteria bacterium]